MVMDGMLSLLRDPDVVKNKKQKNVYKGIFLLTGWIGTKWKLKKEKKNDNGSDQKSAKNIKKNQISGLYFYKMVFKKKKKDNSKKFIRQKYWKCCLKKEYIYNLYCLY